MSGGDIRVLQGDCRAVLATLPDASVRCCVTSPPYYGLRQYLPVGHADGAMEIGTEPSPAEYVAALVSVFREVRRVLADDGTLWVVIGDSYANWVGPSRTRGHVGSHNQRRGTKVPRGLKEKDLIGVPWRLAFALQDDGWWLRQDNVWAKGNPMPESVTDRTTRAHEYVFHLSKSATYFYDAKAIEEQAECDWSRGPALHADQISTNGNSGLARREPTGFRNKRSVWNIGTKPWIGAHFAVMPEELATICILAGSRVGDTVLDPFGGAGTTGAVAARLGRNAVLIDLNASYCRMSERRIAGETPPLPWGDVA